MSNSGQSLTFTFDGRVVRGYKGDTIATAHFTDSVKSFSRSMKSVCSCVAIG